MLLYDKPDKNDCTHKAVNIVIIDMMRRMKPVQTWPVSFALYHRKLGIQTGASQRVSIVKCDPERTEGRGSQIFICFLADF
jgi:hypothetical protein